MKVNADIEIEKDGVSTKLTFDEARELSVELDRLLGKEKTTFLPSVPYGRRHGRDYQWDIPQPWSVPPIITFGAGEKS